MNGKKKKNGKNGKKKKKFNVVQNRKGRLVTEEVQLEDTERRAEVEDKKALAEEKAKRKQAKKIARPSSAKAALHRMLYAVTKPDIDDPTPQRSPRGKGYRQNVLEDKIKYKVKNGKRPKVQTKSQIQREIAKETAKKVGKKALLKTIPGIGAAYSLFESTPANVGEDAAVAKMNRDYKKRNKKGGTITYKMTGGQVVDISYD